MARRVRDWTTALAMVAGLVMALMVATSSASNAAFAGDNGLVLFNRAGDLYTADAAGRNVTRLTTLGGISGAKWSPDGSRIAYRRGGAIYVRSYPTGKPALVASGVAGAPQWSPDGRALAFVKAIPGEPCGEQAVYTVAASGGIPKIAYNPRSENCEHGIDVLTLGTYTSTGALLTLCYGYYDEFCSISDISMNGTHQARFLNEVRCGMEAEYDGKCTFELHLSDGRISPDGSAYLFTGKGGYEAPAGTLPGSSPTVAPGAPERLYAANRDGSRVRLVSTAAGAVNPTWAPDGSAVLFTQKVDGVNSVMRVTGTSSSAVPTVLVRNASQPDWQPRG